MKQTDFSTIIEDSHGNRYYFYYSGSSICCLEISRRGSSKNTVIVNQAGRDFLVTIAEDDSIYLVCSSREKGMLIFTYTNKSWKYEQIFGLYGSNIHLMNMFVIDKYIHILYAKRLPIAKFYNVFHLHNRNRGSWVKNNISEVFAENIEQAYSAVMSENGVIHFANIWYDGSNYLVNYNFYDSAADTWDTSNVAALSSNNLTIRLLEEKKSLHLLCHAIEDDLSVIFCYTKRRHHDKEFEFVSMDKDKIKCENCVPVFYIENGDIYAAWLEGVSYNELVLHTDSPEGEPQKWSRHVEAVIKDIDDVYLLEYIKRDKEKSLSSRRAFYMIDDKYNVTRPYTAVPSIERAKAAARAISAEKDQLDQNDVNQYIPYLMEQIKILSEVIVLLNEKLNRLEESRQPIATERESKKSEESFIPRENTEPMGLRNKSNFRERFMSSSPGTIKAESTVVFAGARTSSNPGFSPGGGIEGPESPMAFSNPVKPALKESPSENEQSMASPPPLLQNETGTKPEIRQPEKPPETAATEEIHDNTDDGQSEGGFFRKLGELFK